jgi:hypothetical protein
MSSRPYQSQLFNFLNRQTQKFADRTATLLRHMKVTAIWGTQIVLYPVYAIFQTARLAGRQLGQSVERSLIRLQLRQFQTETPDRGEILLTSDLPIQKVLTSVKRALLKGGDLSSEPRNALVWIGRIFLAPFKARSSDLVPANPYNIQGIASLIHTHSLVLVLEGNIIFDTLSDEQKRQIERRIVFELARYWRWRRKLYLQPSALALPADRETLIPPVRVFRQLMAWIQSSPVAIATNLFQESNLVPQGSSELDWFVPNVPLSAWNPANLAPKPLPSKKDLDKWAGQLPRWNDLESLIWAAIHYFFGGSRKLATAQGELPYTADASPWLSVAEVFGGDSQQRLIKREFKPVNGTSIVTEALPSGTTLADSLALPNRSLPKFGQSIRNWIQNYLKRFSTAAVLHRPESSALDNPTIAEPTELRQIQLVTTLESTLTQVEAPASIEEIQSAIVTTKSDHLETPVSDPWDTWIETSATHVEYVRSTWQKVLDWFDAGMLWIEQRIMAIWRWISRQLR